MGLSKELKKLIPLYTYRIEWSEVDQVFVVSVEELSGCMTHGDTQEHALKMGHEAVELYLESYQSRKIEIPKPFARKTPRMHPDYGKMERVKKKDIQHVNEDRVSKKMRKT